MDKKIIKELIDNNASPAYVFDIDILKAECEKVKDYLNSADATLCYAMKANPFVTKEMDDFIEKFEVCSPGEYEICNRMEINPEKIVVSGVNKTYESMDRIFALSDCKCTFTAESKRHYEIISEIAKNTGKKVTMFLRLTSGNQFGMDKEELEEVLDAALKNELITIKGIHYFSGTQKKLKKIDKEITELDEYFKYLDEKFKTGPLELEYGSGLSVFYFENDKQPDWEEQIKEFANILNAHKGAFKHVTVEMGRFLAAHCGFYITKVVDKKTNKGENYAIVDGGIHQVNYFGQMLGMKIPFMEQYSEDFNVKQVGAKGENKWNIFGSLCTTNDVIVRELPLEDVEIGDYFVFKNVGAYSVTEGIALFLSRELPAVCTYSKDKGLTTLRKITQINALNS